MFGEHPLASLNFLHDIPFTFPLRILAQTMSSPIQTNQVQQHPAACNWGNTAFVLRRRPPGGARSMPKLSLVFVAEVQIATLATTGGLTNLGHRKGP